MPAPTRAALARTGWGKENACDWTDAHHSVAADSLSGRDIWISSGLRSRASGLREFPGFGRLDLFGIPWNLSSEMSLFNGLRATPGPFFSLGGSFPRQRVEKRPVGFDSKLDRADAPRQAKAAGRAGNHGGRHREGSIWHSNQAKAVFAFLQGNVDSIPFY